jgi:hypothetical protein
MANIQFTLPTPANNRSRPPLTCSAQLMDCPSCGQTVEVQKSPAKLPSLPPPPPRSPPKLKLPMPPPPPKKAAQNEGIQGVDAKRQILCRRIQPREAGTGHQFLCRAGLAGRFRRHPPSSGRLRNHSRRIDRGHGAGQIEHDPKPNGGGLIGTEFPGNSPPSRLEHRAPGHPPKPAGLQPQPLNREPLNRPAPPAPCEWAFLALDFPSCWRG